MNTRTEKQTYTVRTNGNETIQVTGKPVDISGLPCFIYAKQARWVICELASGLSIAEELAPKWQIILHAEERVSKIGLERVREIAQDYIAKHGAANAY